MIPRLRLRSPVLPAFFAGALALACALALPAHAQDDGPILHEYIEPDPNENLDLSRTDASGQLPASVRTPSGTITPPDVRTTPEPRRVYQQPGSDAPGFRPDRDTRRPQVERYDDPFIPSLTPFKRMYAYDAVREDYSLYVRDPQPRALAVGGAAADGDDRFFGDMSVLLRAGEQVRIPSVGPDARLLNLVTNPETQVTVWRDGADNWFILGDVTSRVRVVTEIAITRDAFASEYPEISWGDLPRVPMQPAAHRPAFDKVAQEIGISRRQSPRQVVSAMVSYFRSFAPSDDSPATEGDIYLDLALSKKGVCRHRAFAFLVTSLNIGIPARMIHNEAHAWVEVRDNRMWHRIDLGGAALDLEEEPHLERPPHVPPPDQFAWPTGRDSGADLAHRHRSEMLRDADSSSNDRDPSPGVDPSAPSTGDPAANPSRDLPATTLTIDEVDHDIFRGLPVRISGTARSQGQPCARQRIDVLVLVQGEAAERRIGSLSSDERGDYSGAVVVPADVPIGDHELVVATAGGAKCGPGQTR